MIARLMLVAAFALAHAASTVAGAQPAGPTLKKIQESGAMAIGYRASSVPFSYMGDDQRPVGYSIDLCLEIVEAIKREIGLDTLALNWVPVTPQTRVPLIANGTIQLECGSTTNTLTRQKQVDFSHITFITGTKLLTKKGSGVREVEDLEGKAIALAQGTTNERAVKQLIKSRGLDVKMLNVRDHGEGFRALETDRVDAYSTDHILLHGLAKKAGNPDRYEVVGRFLTYDPYGLMLPRNDSAFRLVVNRTLSGLYRSGAIVDLYRKWFGPVGAPATDLLEAAFIIQALPE